jgi:type IV secretory pathway protease TraF
MTRFRYVMVTTVATLGIAFAGFVPTAPRLVWNASASVPIGFYTVAPDDRIAVPDLVAVIPLCRDGRAIIVDGVPLGEARDHDSFGRDLPVWQGCRVIAEGEVFLMNPDVGDSLDGRYFGPFPASAVIGHAIPLFTDEDGEGRFVWRAPMR